MLNDNQITVAFKLAENTIVSASPGTGKTKTLIARAQRKLEFIPKYKSLALITYTNAAADEISSRLYSTDKNIFIGTIHRFCLEFILRPFCWKYGWDKPKVVSYNQLNEFVNLNHTINFGDNPLEELNKIKRQINGELDCPVEWRCSIPFTNAAEIYYKYLDALNVIDFNEILFRSYKIISENDFVVTSLANMFFEILIDEFQDTNIFQYEIFKTINNKNSCTFFIVGDEKQKIYRFAGAIDNAFTKASNDFKSKIYDLSITYRSTTNIVNAYSSLYTNHPPLDNQSQFKGKSVPIQFVEVNNNNSNEILDKHIAILTKGNHITASEIAILTNTWRDAFFISRHLRQKYQVVGLGALPHRNVNSTSFNLIRCISRHFYSTSARNLRVIRRNVDLHILENNVILSETELTLAVNKVISEINNLNLSVPLIEGLQQINKIFTKVFNFEHSAINEIISLIDNVESTNWTLLRYFKVLSGIDGITINTIHQAKGLEYKAVILNGINEGNIPYQYWDSNTRTRHPLTEDNLIDGRAKLYVGISRAKLLLIILHNWRPSLFIPIIKATV
jgi:superfamily I DNA/RNA helicase